MKTISKLQQDLRNKTISSVELTKDTLKNIKASTLNSFITITDEQALAQARAADERLANGTPDSLTGIPFAHKDIFCTQGVKTSCGSKMLDNFIAPYDATVTEKLNAAGAVMVGKANMDEFAMGSTNEHSYYGPVKNPWNIDYNPGGSSGGSAAAVAARLVPAATGTDTGGSIRQPAAFCGITGIKPTYGRVSRFGMVAFASSLDQGGVFTQTAEDAAIMLNAMCGHDERDSTSVKKAVPDFTIDLNQPLTGLNIGLPKEYFAEGLDPAIASHIEAAKTELEKLGAHFIEISLPHTELALSAYYVIAPAECSANLSRFDGVRYGHRCENPHDLNDLYVRSRTEGFGDEVKNRIMTGTYVLSAAYYDAYYVKAQRVRRLIKQDFVNAFNDVDVILAPTTPTPSFKLGEVTDPVSMYLNDIYTIPTSLAGLPGMSLPIGFKNELPLGMQLIGNYFDEARMLNIAHQYQCHTDWHSRRPK